MKSSSTPKSIENPLDVFKKDKNVLKFMKKYRYQYHNTMFTDLATLVRDAYLEGYHNGLGQYPVTDLPSTDRKPSNGQTEAQGEGRRLK